MECCLELLAADLLVSLQDLGAAGLTSSACEMASAGGVGIDIDVARVPLRNPDLEPFEVMVSESQERMLAVVEPGKVDDVLAICRKWETGGTAIGEVTEGDRIRIFDGDEVVGDMPVTLLVDDCPLYDLEPGRAGGVDLRQRRAAARAARTPPTRCSALLATPTIAIEALGVRAVRLDRAVADRAPARAGRRRRAADPRREHRDRGLDRRQRPPGRLRPLRGHRRGGPRVRARTSPASAPSRSGSPTASTSATPRSRPSPGSSTARPRASPTPARSSACRSSAATSRSTTRPTAGRSTRPRSSAWSASSRRPRGCPTRRCSAGDAIAFAGPFAPVARAARSSRSCAASSTTGSATSRSAPSRRRSPRSATRSARAACAPSTTSATAASPARSPSARSTAAPACRSTSGRWSATTTRRHGCSARVPAASSSPASRRRSRRLVEAGTATLIGVASGETIEIAAGPLAVSVPVADAAAAWRSLGELMEATPA